MDNNGNGSCRKPKQPPAAAPRGWGRKSRRVRNEPPSDADAVPPARRAGPKGLPNGGAEAAGACGECGGDTIGNECDMGSREESDHFGSYVRNLSLHFCKRLFPGLEPMASWSQGNSFTAAAGLPFYGLLSMLTVEDDEFRGGVSPVEFGPLPALQDAVTVVGYPIGGDTISD